MYGIALKMLLGDKGKYTGIIYRVRTSEGELVPCVLLGIDDATLIGAPAVMAEGKSIDLRKFDGIIIDERAAKGRLARPPLTPGGVSIPLKVGDTLEIKDKRAVIVGIGITKGTPL